MSRPQTNIPRAAAFLAATLALVSCGKTSALRSDTGGPDTGAPDASSIPSVDAAGIDRPALDSAVDATAGDQNRGDANEEDAIAACGSSIPLAPFILGFSGVLPADTARIAAVTADGLDLAFDQGAAVKFAWLGPALDFTVSEMVRLEWVCWDQTSLHCWSVVRGGRAVAAAWRDDGPSTGDAPSPLALAGAPALTLGVACMSGGPSACGPTTGSLFDVEADWQGRATSVAVGATASVGPWRLTNVIASAGSGSENGLCVVDGGYVVMVTLMGPP